LDLFDDTAMTDLDIEVTKYVNKNVKCIIRVLLDYLEDSNGFDSEDFLPYNNFRIDNDTWIKMVYDLYDIVRSDVLRDFIKPTYEYLLYVILQWWESFNDIFDNLIPYELDCDLIDKIRFAYELENKYNHVLYAVTNYEEYYYIFFADHDFLPDRLERLVTIYLRNPELFNQLFSDVDLIEYRDLMPKDLQMQFDKHNYNFSELRDKNASDPILLSDILFCCERLQAHHLYKEADENDMNDFIRDLLTALHYDLRDQTRQGTSAGGEDAGEVDILIRKNDLPYSIIEALKLSYIYESYISKHIDKIYKYDTLGNTCNFMVAYVKSKDFSLFWEKYLSYTKSYDYPFKLVKYTVPLSKQYSELKYAVAELKRNDIITKLYHVVIHIPN